MESSTVLAFRIFVMLSCLIIVPMAAIFGSAFPDVVKTVLVDRIVSWSTGKPVESGSTTPWSGFGSVTPSASTAPTAHGSEAPRWGQAPANAQGAEVPHAPPSGIIPATAVHPTSGGASGYATPADARAAVPNVHGADASRAAQPLGVAGQGARHARAEEATPQAGQSDRFTAMERKLREYGATYYLLETWGNEGELYRFHCKMAIGNNPNYTRHFEATDRDALRAMAQVLEKVEWWREGRVQ